jgi:uncharacterized protein Yka (UPF0111/DUF47 family)
MVQGTAQYYGKHAHAGSFLRGLFRIKNRTRDNDFFELFKKHTNCSLVAAELLNQFFLDPQKGEEFLTRLKEVEHDGDRITEHVIELLHKTYIPPYDAQDIYALISRLDDVLDAIYKVMLHMSIYRLRDVSSEAVEIANTIFTMVKAMHTIICDLKSLKRSTITPLIKLIKEHEESADGILRRSLVDLYSERNISKLLGESYETRRVVDVILLVIEWKEILKLLERVTDRVQDVADTVSDIMGKHAVS